MFHRFVSTLIEHLVLSHMNSLLSLHNLLLPMQLAYGKFHSTEITHVPVHGAPLSSNIRSAIQIPLLH